MKAADSLGKGEEYLRAILAYAFEGKPFPKSKDPVMNALYAAAKPSIDNSSKNIKNGKKGGRPPKSGKETETHG